MKHALFHCSSQQLFVLQPRFYNMEMRLHSKYSLRSQNIKCKGYRCTQSTGPGLFMETHDWGEYPSATFRTYRHRGRGAIIAGEAVIFYYPKDIKWMTCDSKWCFKNTCPGSPTISHGMESSEKWQACSNNVVKIYARGRKLGERLQRNDDILLYSLWYSKWISVYGTWIAQGTCPGSGHPPASSKYDTCYKTVFEMWKR